MRAEKRERFVALAEKRVPKAIHALRLVGNLANRHNYAYSEDEASRILSAIEKEFKLLKGRFAEAVLKERPSFKL